MPTVSVIIPTYNRCQFIGETVDSVLAQTYRDLEVIVVDDGSTDDTGKFLTQRYANEPRFRYIWQENAERAVARNTGIKAASGHYIAFLDSDDLWHPTKLAKQMICFAQDPALVMVHCANTFLVVRGGVLCEVPDPSIDQLPEGWLFERLVHDNIIASPTPVVRREAFNRVGMFNTDRRVLCFEDWEMWTRVAAMGPVGYLREPLAYRRIHSGNTERPLAPKNYAAVLVGILATVPLAAQKLVRPVGAARYWKFAAYALETGRRFDSLLVLVRGTCQLRLVFLRSMMNSFARRRYQIGRILFGEKLTHIIFKIYTRASGKANGTPDPRN